MAARSASFCPAWYSQGLLCLVFVVALGCQGKEGFRGRDAGRGFDGGAGEVAQSSPTGPCLAAPNTPVGTDLDLVYPSLPLDQAPGSATHPLPIDKAIEDPHGERCVDGQGSLWIYSYPSGLQRYDRNLDLTFESSVGDYSRPACDELGAWTLSRSGSLGAFVTQIDRYSEQGLIESYEVKSADTLDSIRPGPNGPLLVFWSYNWSTTRGEEAHLEIDGVSYTPPAEPGRFIGLYQLKASEGLPRMRWIAEREFAIDSDGSILTAELVSRPAGTEAFVFKRYGPDGTLLVTKDLPGRYKEMQKGRTVTADGHLILAGYGEVGAVLHPYDDSPDPFVMAVDRNGDVSWSRSFSDGGYSISGVSAVNNDAWVWGTFGEWIMSDGLASFGHRPDIRPDGSATTTWAHRFVAVMDSQGKLKVLEPLGQEFSFRPSFLPIDESHGFMAGMSVEGGAKPNQLGRSGVLPRYFFGSLDLSGAQPPKPMPGQPKETLPRMSVPAMEGFIYAVKSSHDGGAYAVVAQGKASVFIDYPSGRVLPAFISPLDEYEDHIFERQGDSLFQPDYHGQSIRHFRVIDQRWVEQPAIDVYPSNLCSAPLPSGDWLFVSCEERLLAFRRQGSTWALVDEDPKGGGEALVTDGRTLVVGDRLAKGQREGEGLVRLYEIQDDGLGEPVIIKPSDPLPYAPGHPDQDYDYLPPSGRLFGTSVQLQDPWLLVGDSEGSVGYERTAKGWVERWKYPHKKAALLVNGALYVVDYTEPRGTTQAGAIHVYERVNGSWVERQRVVPTQRWPYFGERFTLLPDRLLVVQRGYGEQHPAGAVFDLPLGACPKP